MKAKDVLSQYADGRRNFCNEDLKSLSFKGHDLSGSDFKYANIESTNFTDTILTSTNFSYAKAGLEPYWISVLLIILFLLSVFSGFFLGFSVYFMISLLYSKYYIITNIPIIGVFISLFILSISQGMKISLQAIIFILSVAFILALFLTLFLTGGNTTPLIQSIGGSLAGATTIATVLPGSLVISGAIIVADTMGGVIAGIGFLVASLSILLTLVIFITEVNYEKILFFTTDFSLILTLIGLSIYIVWRALAGDAKYGFIRELAITFGTIGGTNFRGANLTDVNFTSATLKSTDFRKAVLTRTCFNNTKKLDRVRPGTTYLQNQLVVSVSVTRQGQDKNFNRLDLRGVNFQGANLADASFIGTDLSQANLQDADLSRVKLVQTQLDGTNFTGAILTGTYIEDWGITNKTKFHGVRCEYVYMRLPTKENPDPLRKPDNNKEVFADGEFGDFIKPIFDTLDLYHNQGVDPRAIAIAFKGLAENNPEAELEIIAIERRGEDKILLRAKTAITANKSELYRKYFIKYNEIKSLAEQQIQTLISEKDSRIRSLENIVVTISQSTRFYIETGIMSNNFDFTGANIPGGVAGNNYGKMVETQINYADKQNLAEAAIEIEQLLTKLQTQGYSQEQAQQQAAQDLAKKADKDPTVLGKLVKWGQSLGNTAANTTVTEAAKEVFKIALRLSGIPIP